MARIILTPKGKQKLLDELERIEKVELPEIAERLSDAYADGDIPENHPWLTAKEDLNAAHYRIAEIKKMLGTAMIISSHDSEGIHIGDTLEIILNGQKGKFILVSTSELKGDLPTISIESPIGKALFGKKTGTTCEVKTPLGVIIIEILTVACPEA